MRVGFIHLTAYTICNILYYYAQYQFKIGNLWGGVGEYIISNKYNNNT